MPFKMITEKEDLKKILITVLHTYYIGEKYQVENVVG